MNQTKAIVLASTVLTLLGASACGSDSDGGDKGDTGGQTAKLVRCEGINECKGTSECQGMGNSCEGMNECKGMGFITVPAEECEERGGKDLDAEG